MNVETLTTVLRIACLTEGRWGDEQRALLDLALHLDGERGRLSASNSHPHEPELVTMVEATYEPQEEGRRVALTKAQRGLYDRLLAKWRRCDDCKHPMGVHYEHDRCPMTPFDLAWLREHGL